MSQSNPLDILLTHNRWANAQVLNACAPLSPDQFHQTFDIGPGSLHDTTTHILGAMRGWSDMLAGREPRLRLEESRRTAPELLALHEDIAQELDDLAAAHPLDEVVSAERDGRNYSFTRGGVLTHVTTHGMHHRAQCLNMFRSLGVTPLPPTSVLEWMLMMDG